MIHSTAVISGQVRSCWRRAFTVIELLVVIAIIGLLVGLLLPAVQSAREAGRRATCLNNLKQIGVAIHNYHDNKNQLPSGGYWYEGNGSILVHLLPFIEQSNLYDQFQFRTTPPLPPPVASQTLASGKLISTTRIGTYICPSNFDYVHANEVVGSSYAASSGAAGVWINGGCACPTGQAWNAYAQATINMPSGPFHRRSDTRRHEIAEITDGLSTTIFFGETRSACSTHGQSGWVEANNGNGLYTTIIPINAKTCDPAHPDPCKRPCNWNLDFGFKSQHPNGALFLMGDGSVHFFIQNIDHWTYQWLGTMDDGRAAQIP